MRKSIFRTRANGDKVRALIAIEEDEVRINVYLKRKGLRCENWCNKEEVAKYMPKLSKFMPLSGVKVNDFLPIHAYANALYFLGNGEPEKAQDILYATDKEMRELVSLVEYGLHKSKGCWSFFHFDKDAQDLFVSTCKKMKLSEHRKELYNEFLVWLDGIKDPTYTLKSPKKYDDTYKLYAGSVLRMTSLYKSNVDKFCRENGIEYTECV